MTYAELLFELRRYRDRLLPYEYQELLILCRSLAQQRSVVINNGHHNGNGNGNGYRNGAV